MVEITYTRAQDYLLPDLVIGDEPWQTYGKYGMLHKTYLKNHKPGKYRVLLLSGRLDAHLASIDKQARAMLNELTEKYLQTHHAPDKAEQQIEWAAYMNNLKHSMEEIVLKSLVYRTD